MSDPLIVEGMRHGAEVRGEKLQSLTFSPLFEGRFGRMFRTLPGFVPSEDALDTLADHMFESAGKDKDPGEGQGADPRHNPHLPAGFTYLGQFIDHDITFDPASSLQQQNDPNALHDFRTPRFDLDSIYGGGPSQDPFMYDQDPQDDRFKGVTLLLGNNVGNGRDVPRNGQGRALIGDPRNDENLIVSQLHCAFLRFHNKVAKLVADNTSLAGQDLFVETQRRVRWHYQWMIVHDFIKRVAGGQVVNQICPDGATSTQVLSNLQFFHWKNSPFMPVEFSVAAYRFGHSMIRFDYSINDGVTNVPVFSDSTDPLSNLNGFRPLPDQWGFQWRFFFELNANKPPQLSHRIDTKLSKPLVDLPKVIATHPRSLALRNLLRGRAFSLPSGQSVATAMSLTPLTDQELDITSVSSEFAGNAPLWFYILKEAELQHNGERLGDVGGRMVAEVLLGLLAGDPHSYVSEKPTFTPSEALAPQGEFGMRELIDFALG
jgi:heme peroxidase